MPSLITEGLIIKRHNFGEADRILTVLTDRYGKISVVARGVRKITSRRAGNIELLNLVKLHLFKAKSYTLTEAESISTFPKLKQNLVLTTSAFHILELIDRLVAEGQPHRDLFDLTVAMLKLLERNPRQILLRAYEVKTLSILGFWGIRAIRELGEVDPKIEQLLNTLESSSWTEISLLTLSEAEAVALERLLRYYIEKILESDLKSVKVMRDIRDRS